MASLFVVVFLFRCMNNIISIFCFISYSEDMSEFLYLFLNRPGPVMVYSAIEADFD
ncbi:MAG: hypothetical protein IPN67_12525 [Bacteroidales bacterium]|nr:hypothetical protein [Bacteroidales bacterium]